MSENHHGVHLVSFKWREVGVYFVPMLFLLLCGLAKLMFHRVHWLSSRVPESCLLILLGSLAGIVINKVGFFIVSRLRTFYFK